MCKIAQTKHAKRLPKTSLIFGYPFTGESDNEVDKPRFEDGRVWINNSQYFANAPAVSWDFYIGDYQPAQKRLKDRKGHALSFADVQRYQHILKILSETDRIMQTITMKFITTRVAMTRPLLVSFLVLSGCSGDPCPLGSGPQGCISPVGGFLGDLTAIGLLILFVIYLIKSWNSK